ncbi:MAG: hypothetical protein ACREJO_05265 [Phycisphaerales bacterium]
MPSASHTRLFGFAVLAAFSLLTAGCNWWDSPGGTLEARSDSSGSILEPVLPTAIYRNVDEQTVDVYMTDLPVGRLADPNDNLAGLTGQLVQLHIFMIPEGGKTPQSPQACTATVRHMVVADGIIGVYGGGGFVDSSNFGEPTLTADIKNVSMRLVESMPGFADRLGTVQLTGTVTAGLNERAARSLAGRVQELTFRLTPAAGPDQPK